MNNSSCFDWVIQNNFPDADFWITNRGTDKTVGKPTKEFQPYLTGIQCPALILPDYGYYLCIYFHSIGIWGQYAVGTLTYKDLRISDVRKFFNQISHQHREQYEQIKIPYHFSRSHSHRQTCTAGS